MNTLPKEIILHHIIPYTYSPQPKNLLEDIRNFSYTLNLISNIYYNRWIVFFHGDNPQDRNWLINDIHRFINQFNISILEFWNRKFKINNNLSIGTYLSLFSKYNKTPVESQIRIYWSIFTIEERYTFIKIYGNSGL